MCNGINSREIRGLHEGIEDAGLDLAGSAELQFGLEPKAPVSGTW